jgi:hypothetical protein
MYIEQTEPDKEAKLINGTKVTPLVTLKDKWGGVSHIIEDDHCYVLINDHPTSATPGFRITPYWYKEAVEALSRLVARRSL